VSGPSTAPGNLSPLNAVFLLPAELFVQLRRLKNTLVILFRVVHAVRC